MLSLRRIICTTDFSAGSQRPLAYATDMARRCGAEVHLFYAYVQRRVLEPDELRDRLIGMVPDLSSGVKMSYHVDVGSAVAPCVLEYAERISADAIVVGTRCPHAYFDGLLGDVTRKVLYHARCAVITVDTSAFPGTSAPSISSVLVPVDCSESSPELVDGARQLAGLYSARLDLLHVISENPRPSFYPNAGRSAYDDAPDIEDRARHALEGIYSGTEGPDISVSFTVARGAPAEGILEMADQLGSGLLFMATHCCADQSFLPSSNVTEMVARHARVPVFTTKTDNSGALRASRHARHQE